MSVACPVCSAQINEDFGLVECPECGTSLMVSIDGSVQTQSNEPVQDYNQNLEDYEDPTPSGPQGLEEEPILSEEPIEFATEESAEEPVEKAFEEPIVETLEEEPLIDAPMDEHPEEHSEEPTNSDMSNLANDIEVKSQDGPLVYTIHIAGVDTADIRRDLKDSLVDMRLRIDVDAIIDSIQQGEVSIANLSSVKASILVQRLRVLPIEISWSQEGHA